MQPDPRGVSSLRPRTDEYVWGLTAVETNVEAVRLDDYLAETSGPIALWIDVEGAAAEVIRGLSGIGDRIVLIHVEAESKEIWRDQASWATALGQIQELGRFEVAASASETGADQHNYLLMRRDAPRRRAARAVLLAASPRGATRAFVPAKHPDGWRGVLGRVVGAAVRASARGA